MSLSPLTDAHAVRQAAKQCDAAGRQAFLDQHEFGRSTQYFLYWDGRLYDAKAIGGVAYGIQYPERGTLPNGKFSGGEADTNAVLRRLGFTIVDADPTTAEGEARWRAALWSHITSNADHDGLVPPGLLRDFDAYGGQQGVWVNAGRTRKVHPSGVAFSVLHTGVHYADDLSDTGVLYHYPHTSRQPGRDASEIAALKTCKLLNLPVLVISKPASTPGRRLVQLGWVDAWNDDAELFEISFSPMPPAGEQPSVSPAAADPNAIFGSDTRTVKGELRIRPGQRIFKRRVFAMYGQVCPLSGIAVPQMLDAAHLVPVANNGSDDPSNGLPLNAALHRAFDAGLFAINPDTLLVETRANGPTMQDLGITAPAIDHLPQQPARAALEWRYNWWRS